MDNSTFTIWLMTANNNSNLINNASCQPTAMEMIISTALIYLWIGICVALVHYMWMYDRRFYSNKPEYKQGIGTSAFLIFLWPLAVVWGVVLLITWLLYRMLN